MPLPSQDSHDGGASASEPCREALTLLTRHDFAHWRGLPPSCSLGNVTARFPLLHTPEWRGIGILGQAQAAYAVVRAGTFFSPLWVWLREERVLAIDANARELSGELPGWLTALGEPAARLDHFTDGLLSKAGEWVYPERGLSLFLDEEGQVLLHFAVFPPMTLEGYEASTRLHLHPRKGPPR